MADNKASVLVGVTWMEVALTIVAIGARFFTQISVNGHHPGNSDYFMLLAVDKVFSVAAHFGVGRHINSLSPAQVIQAVKYDWLSQVPSTLATCVARISIAIFLIRLFGMKRWLRLYLYIMTTLQTAVCVLLVIVILVQCGPVTALWGASQGHCWSPAVEQDIAYLAQAILTVIDLTYVLFPVYIVWSLNMKLKNKLGLVAILSGGLLAMVASIVKTVEVRDLSGRDDFTYDIVNLTIWAVTEQSLIIIVGCVPTLKPLFTQKVNKFQGVFYLLGRYGGNSKTGYNAHSDTEGAFNLKKHSEGNITAESSSTRNTSEEDRTPPLPTASRDIIKTTKLAVDVEPAARVYNGGDSNRDIRLKDVV